MLFRSKKRKVSNDIYYLQNEFVDLTESLEKEHSEQDRIISAISHDIKTPLTSIIGYSDIMLNKKINGIIALSAFGCGPDSLMVDEIQYHAKEMNIPMIHLNIDEHTGEAGFVTRIEAFVDMLMRKKRKSLESQNIINLLHTAVEMTKKSSAKNLSECEENVLNV